MREILCRGKWVDNGEWQYGSFIPKTHEIVKCPFDIDRRRYVYEFCEVDTSTVGRYTGLTDKNGNEIFEGDILDVSSYVIEGYGIVKFGEHKSGDMSNDYLCGNLGFYIDFPNKKNQYVRKDILYFLSECIVIGNIHDNPEMLEVNNE